MRGGGGGERGRCRERPGPGQPKGAYPGSPAGLTKDRVKIEQLGSTLGILIPCSPLLLAVTAHPSEASPLRALTRGGLPRLSLPGPLNLKTAQIPQFWKGSLEKF